LLFKEYAYEVKMKKSLIFLLLGFVVLSGCKTSTDTAAVANGYATPKGINAVPSN
jgi:uncharacterized lipoprotein YajG|tara:strand:- start:186 stop:350 length:165 start_codon:yes stop_codon:yes gene_type:complete